MTVDDLIDAFNRYFRTTDELKLYESEIVVKREGKEIGSIDERGLVHELRPGGLTR